jgi:hypothetical protein
VNEPLRITLADAVRFLESQGIGYALIGGLAISVRAMPRATVDVDLVIAADVERALSLVESLPNSDFAPLFDGVEEVVQSAFILPLRHRRTNVKVDVAIGLSGFELAAINRAEPMDLAGLTVSVATAEDLLIMKVLSDRPQDDQDARGLVIARGSKLDWDYCMAVATGLGESIGQSLAGRIETLRKDALP